MTTLKQLLAIAAAFEDEADALDRKSGDKRDEAKQVRAEIGARLAGKRYGLKVGDVIEIKEERGFYKRIFTYRLRITSFEADGEDDASPNIVGQVLKKDGGMAARAGRSNHPYLKTVYYWNRKSIRKVEG